MLKIGDQILFENKLFTIEGRWDAPYLSAPTVITLPPAQPYPLVSQFKQIRVCAQNGDLINAARYEFQYHLLENYGELISVD